MNSLPFVISIICVLLAGCSSVNYTPYRGAQQAWKTAPGALVKEVAGVSIYYGFPDREYNLLGMLTVEDAPSTTLARRCRALGGDALLVITSHQSDAGSMNLGTHGRSYYNSYNFPVTSTVQQIAVIQFKERPTP